MNQVVARKKQRFPVSFGTVELYLQSYEIKGACALTERVTADNLPALTASYPKGTRLTMRGTLSPLQDAGEVIVLLAEYLQDAVQQDVNFGTLTFKGARLCNYQAKEEDGAVRVMVQFYCEQVPQMQEGAEA